MSNTREYPFRPDPEQSSATVHNLGATKSQALAALETLRAFVGESQLAVVRSGMRGEEKQFFFDKAVELSKLIAAMPKTYEQDGAGELAVVHLHYFKNGCDWFITEKDSDPDGEGQVQAFGLADLFRDGGELGYISIVEILSVGGELDFYFKPRALGEIRAEREFER
jgi:hypothetical protein